MSKASYRRNRIAGVTGRWSDTCFPAALEQISPKQAFRPETYIWYGKAVNYICDLQGQQRRQANPLFKTIFKRLAEEMGASYEDSIFKRFRHPEEFKLGVAQLLQDNYRVTLDITTANCIIAPRGSQSIVHAVGLEPVGESGTQVKLVSTWIPTCLQGTLSLDTLFPYAAQVNEPLRKIYPFNDSNVFALPT